MATLTTMEKETGMNESALLNARLTFQAFTQLAGTMAGYPFVKIVLDRNLDDIHFINNSKYPFHADYIAENILGTTAQKIDADIDNFNKSVYLSGRADRRFYLGIVALHRRQEGRFYTLETVEIDNMDADMLKYFYDFIKKHLEPAIPLFFKPANHFQETMVSAIDAKELPRLFNHELFASSKFIPLNAGTVRGRLRIFRNETEFKQMKNTIEWYDILLMPRVPDDIPRVSGIVNSHHTTPLSHTNVLATGWGIPNAIQIGAIDQLEILALNNQWVSYTVDMNDSVLNISKAEDTSVPTRPSWSIQTIRLEEPETLNTPIVELSALRMSDRFRYGTKAANLGELSRVLEQGSDRLLGFYRVKRPPRSHLLSYLAHYLKMPENAESTMLNRAAWDFLRTKIMIPRGIAIPFSVQQTVLESSAKVQQGIGKLKMALELNSREIDPLCLQLQQMIRGIRIPDAIRDYIDSQVANTLGGVSNFVVRSSSNAEDLENFSAAGMYESIVHVNTSENLFQSIKDVWASLISPRSVRLLHQVGISLDDCYMGVIVQEEVKSDMGGVMVTTNPMNRGDFRNVYVNVSTKSVEKVVHGEELPYQYLYNTVEGGGRTLSIGDAKEDLDDESKSILQDLAFAGRLLQAHFSRDYTFAAPVDVEWIAGRTSVGEPSISLVQLRPYTK